MKRLYLLTIAITVSLCGIAQADQLFVKNDEKGIYLEHKVAAKEGLYSIGRLYNVSPKFIAAYNKMDLNQGIDVDQVLRIPLTDTNFTQKTTSGTPVYYQVIAGDGLLRVSNLNNKVALKSLRDWNDLTGDNILEGSPLIVGFLMSKEMVAVMANNRAKRAEAAKKLEEKPVVKTDAVVVKNDPPVTKTEPVATVKTEIAEEKKKEEPKATTAVAREEVKIAAAATDAGYFKSSFDQQMKGRSGLKNSTVTSGIFKTASGWQDAKYYMLIDDITPGTIVRITNPENNKAVYAKVLGEMNGIRQNQGLDIRISNAAASALKIADEEKFVVKVDW